MPSFPSAHGVCVRHTLGRPLHVFRTNGQSAWALVCSGFPWTKKPCSHLPPPPSLTVRKKGISATPRSNGQPTASPQITASEGGTSRRRAWAPAGLQASQASSRQTPLPFPRRGLLPRHLRGSSPSSPLTSWAPLPAAALMCCSTQPCPSPTPPGTCWASVSLAAQWR